MAEALVLVDVIKDFRHEDGDSLLRSFRCRHGGLVRALGEARVSGVPVVYANDNQGVWDGDAPALVRTAVRDGLAGELIAAVAPAPGDRFIVKPRWSAFDHTPLELILESLGVGRLRLAGTATEMCVLETAIDANRRGFGVTVIADACASIDPDRERAALDFLERVLGLEVTGLDPR